MKNTSLFFSLLFLSLCLFSNISAFAKTAMPTNLHELAYEGKLQSLQGALKKTTDINIKDENGGTLLMAAANNGHLEVIRFLIKKNANLNLRNMEDSTALYYAIINEHSGAAKLLIDNGAEVSSINDAGDSALIVAVAVNDTKIIQQLLKKYPELLNKVNKIKNSPLHEAIRKGSQGTFSLILNAGADKNLTDDLGRNALDIAKAEKNKYAEKLLSK